MRVSDIAVNLTDPQYTGVYHGKSKHASDLDAVVARAKARGVEKILITGTSLQESREALALAKKYGQSSGGYPRSTKAHSAQSCTVQQGVTLRPHQRSINIPKESMATSGI